MADFPSLDQQVFSTFHRITLFIILPFFSPFRFLIYMPQRKKKQTGNIHVLFVGIVLRKVQNQFVAINVTSGSILNAPISPYPDSNTLALQKTEMYLFIVLNADLLLIVLLNTPLTMILLLKCIPIPHNNIHQSTLP